MSVLLLLLRYLLQLFILAGSFISLEYTHLLLIIRRAEEGMVLVCTWLLRIIVAILSRQGNETVH